MLLRNRLLAVAASSRDVLGEAEQKKKAAEADLRAGEERLRSLQTDAKTIEKGFTTEEIRRQVMHDLSADEDVSKELRKIAAELNIPELESAAQGVKAQILEIGGLGRSVQAVFKSLLKPGSMKLWLISVGFLGIAVVAAWLLTPYLPSSGLGELVGRAIKILVGVTAFLAPILTKAKSVLSSIEKVKKSNEDAIARKIEERKQGLEKEQARLRENVAQAQKQIEEAAKKVKEVEDQLAALQGDRQMYDFVQARHESKDYTQHLGLIAKARSDFERLTELMKKVKERKPEPEADPGKTPEPKRPPLPRIDRIVLYIDDLDRCPETKVVEVLQAVHLLLAFPLFIVVVGVDPRWLLHSLKMHSVAFRQKDGKESGLTPEEIDQWRTTPLNYLEKIFQIPYTLRPMTPTGFNELIDEWKVAATKKEEITGNPVKEGADPEKKRGPLKEPERGKAGDGKPKDPPERVKESEPVKKEETQNKEEPEPLPLPEPVRIEPHEWEFMKLLGPLIATPRAAKRFVNVYRLLRASLDPGRRPRFSEEAFRPAQVLLAMVMGHPEAASEIVGRLIQDNPAGGWWDFVEKFRPAKGTAPAEGEDSAHALFKDVDVIKGVLPDILCKAVRDLVPDVARYSFRSGRLLLDSAV